MESALRLFVSVIFCLIIHVMANSINIRSNGDVIQGLEKIVQNGDNDVVDDYMNLLEGSFIKRHPNFTRSQFKIFSKFAIAGLNHYQYVNDARKEVMDNVNSFSSEWNIDSVLLKVILNRSIDMTHDSYRRRDCGYLMSNSATGLYIVYVGPGTPVQGMCNMDCDGGKWLVIQQRMDGSVDFNRTWKEYKDGFGNLEKEFWLGNEKIHSITSAGEYELRIDVHDWEGNKWFALYKKFEVGSETTNYTLKVSDYSGTAGDSMKYHNNKPFSTKDRDNDKSSQSCSITDGGGGGWWFKSCQLSNINGLYAKGSGYRGVYWYHAKKKGYSMRFARMMIRRV